MEKKERVEPQMVSSTNSLTDKDRENYYQELVEPREEDPFLYRKGIIQQIKVRRQLKRLEREKEEEERMKQPIVILADQLAGQMARAYTVRGAIHVFETLDPEFLKQFKTMHSLIYFDFTEEQKKRAEILGKCLPEDVHIMECDCLLRLRSDPSLNITSIDGKGTVPVGVDLVKFLTLNSSLRLSFCEEFVYDLYTLNNMLREKYPDVLAFDNPLETHSLLHPTQG